MPKALLKYQILKIPSQMDDTCQYFLHSSLQHHKALNAKKNSRKNGWSSSDRCPASGNLASGKLPDPMAIHTSSGAGKAG
uniref:Uncharacterized protein n=1 Tax=Romanomermis culicivorax TaxID=13658 RepID=A0A915JMU9_ROMCU